MKSEKNSNWPKRSGSCNKKKIDLPFSSNDKITVRENCSIGRRRVSAPRRRAFTPPIWGL